MLMSTNGFYFLRHGESEANLLGVIAGSADSPLSETGLSQARAAADICAPLPIRRIYSSPLRRAWDTALPVAERLGVVVQPVLGFKERHFGSLQGRAHIEKEMATSLPGDAETWPAFFERCWQAFQGLEVDEHTLIVGHSGTFRVIAHGLGMDIDRAPVGNALPLSVARRGRAWGFEGITAGTSARDKRITVS